MNGATAWPCLSARGGGSLLRVAVVPNARRTGADGLHDGALRVRLAAQPVEGQANARLLAWLAEELGCAKRAVRLQRGDTARRKVVEIDLPDSTVADWLARVVGAAGAATAPRAKTP
ncbi:MAG: DUF167 domain-containing protein [Rubrivivax sp.]|nr:DUF167 domain-containing protein [Rubrivivax sp.]